MTDAIVQRGHRLMDRPEYASKPKPLTKGPDTFVSEAVLAMSEKNYGSVVVVDKNESVIGVVTERDVMNKLVAKGLDAKKTKLSDIMTADPRLARETDDMIDWLQIMSNERFRRLPVVDENNRIKAIFTQGDFVSYTWPDLMYQMGSIARATLSKNRSIVVIAAGIAVYTLLVLFAIGLFT